MIMPFMALLASRRCQSKKQLKEILIVLTCPMTVILSIQLDVVIHTTIFRQRTFFLFQKIKCIQRL